MSQHPAALPEDVLLGECEQTHTRRSGPGGQHRNKVETAVVLVHQPSGVRAEANERRSQQQNKQQAVFRLRVNLALQVRSELAEGQSTSRLWKARCRGGKVVVNPGHEDFPALLAEALDTLAALQWNVQDAARRLGCSTSQLAKLLKAQPRALQQVNQQRKKLDLGPLK